MKRQRGRGRRSGGGNSNNPNKHFESNGPDVKIRGSAQQILDKYQQYARDAQSSGDRVNAENYLQHAEHYYRVLAAMKPVEKPPREPREGDVKEGEEANAEASEASTGNEDGQKREPRENTRGRGRSRNRRDRDDRKPEGDEATAKTDTADAAPESEPATTQSDEADMPAIEEKPKRRRTYKKRDAAPVATEDGDDGVMKTLSRGRKKVDPKVEADAPTVEASEASATED